MDGWLWASQRSRMKVWCIGVVGDCLRIGSSTRDTRRMHTCISMVPMPFSLFLSDGSSTCIMEILTISQRHTCLLSVTF